MVFLQDSQHGHVLNLGLKFLSLELSLAHHRVFYNRLVVHTNRNDVAASFHLLKDLIEVRIMYRDLDDLIVGHQEVKSEIDNLFEV
jgi:hypothetical protein